MKQELDNVSQEIAEGLAILLRSQTGAEMIKVLLQDPEAREQIGRLHILMLAAVAAAALPPSV
jgi:hypothetical protein